eukprot:1186643-Pleurochrysis_carterae.AAC.1
MRDARGLWPDWLSKPTAGAANPFDLSVGRTIRHLRSAPGARRFDSSWPSCSKMAQTSWTWRQ